MSQPWRRDYLWQENHGAKLASLFGLDQTVSAAGNESFQYTAPKQPKKGPVAAGTKSPKPTGAAGPAPSVLLATAVHAYKYVSGQYVKQGKFGAAVLGNHNTKEYRILLYISQQQPVTAVRIHPGFAFTVQLNNYAAFYDDQRQSWSVMFESETAAVDFSKQVCIAKCNSAPSLDVVLTQDLTPGDGQAADAGDLLEVAYTGWLLQNHGIGQMFDSNLQKDKFLRLKLGSGKVIKGWEDGMLGMKKGGKRFLVIPPAVGYGSQGVSGRIPANATLLFEVEVKRMKQKDLGGDRHSIGSRDSPVSITDSIPTDTLPQAPTSVPPKPGEPAVRAKSNSISEQLANPDMAKAKLIYRMAKMGQPMLPFLSGSSPPQPDSSDSEIEDPNTQRTSPHPAAPVPVRPTPQISHTPVTGHIPAPVPQQQLVPGLLTSSTALLPVGPISSQAPPSGSASGFQPYAGLQYTYSQNPAAVTQLQPVGHIYPAPVHQPATYPASGDVTSFLMTEARQHSTEIRMAIGKVIDKIDTLAAKVDSLPKEHTAGASLLLPGISSITMESAMIMNNIQRIIQENERLKQEVLDKSSRIEEQNGKIGELINRNQRYVEQSNMLMEQRNDSLNASTDNTQARMLHAMQEKHALHMDLGRYQVKVAEELAAATGQVSRLQLEITDYQKRQMDLQTQLVAAQQEAEKFRTELGSLQAQLIEVKETSEQTRARAKTEKDSRRSLELRLVALEEEISDLKVEKENLEKSLVERKRKAQQERQRAEEEREELRRTFQEETENLRQLLKKTREQAATEQLSSCRSRDEQMSELQEQAAQLQPLKEKCSHLQSLVTSLTQQLTDVCAREKERSSAQDQSQENLSQLQEQAAQLQPLRQKCAQLQAQVLSLEEQLREAHAKEGGGIPATDLAEEVKKIMNGVFQSLRKEFDLEESYSGRVVLGGIMSTIKATTLQLLNKPQEEEPAGSSSDEEEEDDDDKEVPVPLGPKSDLANPSLNNANLVNHEEKEENINIAAQETSDVAEEKHEEVNGHTEAESQPGNEETPAASTKLAEPEETVHVKVIQEDLDAPSALVHMISSDTPESSTYVEEKSYPEKCETTVHNEWQPLTNETFCKTREAHEDLTLQEDSPVAKEVPTLLAANDLEDEKPEAPPPLGSDDDMNSPLPLKKEISAPSSAGIRAPRKESPVSAAKSHQEKKTTNFSLDQPEEEDLFKIPSTTKPKHEEEDEEDVCLKGRPPPTPLFGDDNDDDDLDWLG
ncbi:FK506-binding protein 15 isoform X2 [Pseudophryne corroboree]|uniref:FK506-binding protein 15 isoform X2 n=1 Tax=Pseudophryne corroboree TaxID=495146 RepID=UPI00308131B1